MRKLTTGDDVIVITGKDKGRRGTVRQILEDKAVVDGVNVARKHQKGNPNSGVQGGIIDKEMPIDISNLMVFNPGRSQRVENSNDQVGTDIQRHDCAGIN